MDIRFDGHVSVRMEADKKWAISVEIAHYNGYHARMENGLTRQVVKELFHTVKEAL